MEEQRQRHEDETQKVQLASLNEALNKPVATDTAVSMDTNESGLARVEEAALPVSHVTCAQVSCNFFVTIVCSRRWNTGIDSIYVTMELTVFVKEYLDDMTDEEQLAMALQMSLQSDAQAMETDSTDAGQQPGTSQEANSESLGNSEIEQLAENREFLQVQCFTPYKHKPSSLSCMQEALSNIEGVNPQNALQILDKMSSEKKEDIEQKEQP